jgi:hypothetical protein
MVEQAGEPAGPTLGGGRPLGRGVDVRVPVGLGGGAAGLGHEVGGDDGVAHGDLLGRDAALSASSGCGAGPGGAMSPVTGRL